MMELADGTKVARGDKDWQYWKFAWRQQHFTEMLLGEVTLCGFVCKQKLKDGQIGTSPVSQLASYDSS